LESAPPQMYIPEEKISEILNTSDIVDIVSESVILKKSGRNFFGLCPFHSEKTPSFSVNPNKQIFHCFGCSAGGNVLTYVMKYHGISFPEAAKMVARKYNIEIAIQKMDPKKRKAMELKERLFRLNKRVMNYYHEQLKANPNALQAREYLKKRKLSDDMIETFKLGFSPDAWESVVRQFKTFKVAKEVAVQSGLILKRNKKDGYYDRFRNRIMFPIFDINMQVAGFGGRVMNDDMPKYMNSPETPVYNKSRILYGLHASKQFIRQEGYLYIVEGYFDFLSLYAHGIKNTVASLGTALTAEHIRILKGYAPKMILVFDSDAAGISAAKRSIKQFNNEGVDTRVLVLPKGSDPDSYILEHGAVAFKELAKKAKTVMQFLLQVSKETHGFSVEGRIKILDDMIKHLCQIHDSALRSMYVKELAETLNIDERAVLEKVRDFTLKSRGSAGTVLTSDKHPQMPESEPRERQMISIMLNYPRILKQVEEKKILDAFYSEKLKRLGRLILQVNPGDGSFVTKVMASIKNDDEQALVAQLAMSDDFSEENTDQSALSIMNRILRVRQKRENILTSKIISAEKGSDSELMALLKLKQAEIQQLHEH
jgi:DNA primase